MKVSLYTYMVFEKQNLVSTIFMQFLQGVSIALLYPSPVLATIGMSVRPSVCVSHADIVIKRRKLGS